MGIFFDKNDCMTELNNKSSISLNRNAKFTALLSIMLYLTPMVNNAFSKSTPTKNTTDARHASQLSLAREKPSVFALMYHKVLSNDSNIEYPSTECTQREVEEQLTYLKKQGYTTITLDQLYNFLTLDTPLPEKSFIITSDDGYYNNYERLYPILKKLDMHAAIAVTTDSRTDDINGRTNESTPFSWNQAKAMEDYVEYTSHTVSHADLKEISANKPRLYFELIQSNNNIKEHLGKKSDFIIYPYGHYNKAVEQAAKSEYKMGFTIENDSIYFGDDIMALTRFTVKHGYTGKDILNKVEMYKRIHEIKISLKGLINN